MSAPAQAAVTVSKAGNTISIVGDDDANVVFETSFDEQTPWFTTPAGGTLVAGAGCTQLSPTGVECPGANASTNATVDLRDGDDLFLWNNTSVPLTIDGGSGDDELSGGAATDSIDGGPGDDSIVGFGGDDRLDGGSGSDQIDGSSGDDRIDGGTGADKLNGDGEGDVDSIAAAKRFGNDTIISRDDAKDEVDCEGGTDTAIADRADQVAGNCEEISFSQDGSGATGPEGSGGSSGGSPVLQVGNTALTLKVQALKIPRLRRFAAGTPIRLRITPSAACRGSATLGVTAAQAKKLRYRGTRSLAVAKRLSLKAGQARTVTLRPGPAFRRASKRRASVTITAMVSCTPLETLTSEVSGRLRLRIRR